jgi:hypothetical protein
VSYRSVRSIDPDHVVSAVEIAGSTISRAALDSTVRFERLILLMQATRSPPEQERERDVETLRRIGAFRSRVRGKFLVVKTNSTLWIALIDYQSLTELR